MSQIRLINQLKTCPSTVRIIHPLTPVQRCVYTVVKQNYPTAVLAGGFVSHNIGGKYRHTDIDIFINRGISFQNIGKEAENLKKLLIGILGSNYPWIHFTSVESNKYWSKKSARSFYRLVNGSYDFDIILSQGPTAPSFMNQYQQQLWDAFYILAGFDIILSRAAILNYCADYSHAEVLRFGSRGLGLKELAFKIAYTKYIIRYMHYILKKTSKRWISKKESNFHRTLKYVEHQLERYQKYIPQNEYYENLPEVPNTLSGITTVGLLYCVNDNLKYSFTPCIRSIENGVLEWMFRETSMGKVIQEILIDRHYWLNFIRTGNLPTLLLDPRCSLCDSNVPHPHKVNRKNFSFIMPGGYFIKDQNLPEVYSHLEDQTDWLYADRMDMGYQPDVNREMEEDIDTSQWMITSSKQVSNEVS